MTTGTAIISVTARQVCSDRGHPGLEATVETESGAVGVSVGAHEVEFACDGGTRWRGKGVGRAVDNVNNLIAPVLTGMDASRQLEIDEAILNTGGPGAKERLGGKATAAVSAALGIPLYQHIGGVSAFTLPVPGVIALVGSERYGGARSGGKLSYSFMAYGFETFSEASYAAWDLSMEWPQVLN